MKKVLLAAIAATVIAAPVSAAQFLLTYTATNRGTPASASLRLVTSNALNTSGGHDVVSVTGNVDGDAITALTPNPNQSNASYSADGLFIYDNVLFGSAPYVSVPGLLFTSNGHEYNLFSDSAVQYELYQATPNFGYTGHSIGTLSALAVPEPAQWALMFGGFTVVGGALRRRRGLVTVFA